MAERERPKIYSFSVPSKDTELIAWLDAQQERKSLSTSVRDALKHGIWDSLSPDGDAVASLLELVPETHRRMSELENFFAEGFQQVIQAQRQIMATLESTGRSAEGSVEAVVVSATGGTIPQPHPLAQSFSEWDV